jgi:hypothetical protein
MPQMRKAARVATDSAKHAPGFIALFDHELACLDPLPAWMLRLFVHVVRSSNFVSGAGMTRLADLVKLMTPIQPRSGPKHYVPDVWAVRRAILAFERACILVRDKRRSAKEGFVFFLVAPRVAKVRPTPGLAGGTRRGVDNRKASIHAV